MDDENLNGAEVMLPGFRFHPTDEELVGFYLKRKIKSLPLSIELIRQLDIYKYEPWDLPKLAMAGEKEWYFYCPRDRKYRNSMRPNRVTKAGFWKATGTDRPIFSSHGSVSKCIGLKKSLVFYRGRAAKGIKTDWMMHEFRLPSPNDVGRCSTVDADKYTESWAICRIFRKTTSTSQRPSVLTTRNYRPPFSQPPIKYDSGVDENNVPIIDSQRDVAKLNPIIEEPCRPSFSNDGHYYSLDPTKLAFPSQLDNISLALPRMQYSILGDDHNPSNDSVIPHLPAGVQTKSDIVVGQHGWGNDRKLPFKSIEDGNGGGETREDMYIYDSDLTRCSTGSTRGNENAWISDLIWDYELSLWPKYCELPYYWTDCYT